MKGTMASTAVWGIRYGLVRGKLRQIAIRNMSEHFENEFPVCIDGVSFRLRPATNATDKALLLRGPTAKAIGLAQVLPYLKDGDIFVDLGANAGIFTCFAAKRVGPWGRVIAVEPMPEMLECLQQNIAANNFENVTVFPTAVGDKPVMTTLCIHPVNRGASSLVADFDGTNIEVPVLTLENIVASAGIDRIDFLKIDVEGFEDRVLIPYITSAPRALWPRRLFMETRISHRWERECVDFLLDAGYGTLWQDPNDITMELK